MKSWSLASYLPFCCYVFSTECPFLTDLFCFLLKIPKVQKRKLILALMPITKWSFSIWINRFPLWHSMNVIYLWFIHWRFYKTFFFMKSFIFPTIVLHNCSPCWSYCIFPVQLPSMSTLLLLVGNELHGLLDLFLEARYCVTTGVHGYPDLLPFLLLVTSWNICFSLLCD